MDAARQGAAWRLILLVWALIVVAQSAVIVVLLLQRGQRSRAERAVRESEERFRQMADQAPVMMWTGRPDTTLDYVNATCAAFIGLPVEKLLNEEWLKAVHPDDVAYCQSVYKPAVAARQSFRMEFRLLGPSGAYWWALSLGVPRIRPDGTLAGYLGCTVDITDRKMTEQAIRESEAMLQATNRQIQDLAGRLIASQELERARIARDLHDGLSQDLAGLSIALSSLKRRAGGDVHADVASLQERALAIAQDVRHLSHDLHPSALDHAGLVAALSAHCTDLQQQLRIAVSFAAHGDFAGTDRAIALCLYRIAQEALRNVATHAEARRADVTLHHHDGAIELTITDDGKGFDIGAARHGRRGLGLVSMTERVRLAGGTVNVRTELNRGTSIRVSLASAARAVVTHEPDAAATVRYGHA